MICWTQPEGRFMAKSSSIDPGKDMEREWYSITTQHKFPIYRTHEGLGFASVARTKDPDIMLIVFIMAFTQGEGKGTKLLKIIMGLADKHGVTLELCPSPTTYNSEGADTGPKAEDLENWYRKHGFTEKTADGYALARKPKRRTA